MGLFRSWDWIATHLTYYLSWFRDKRCRKGFVGILSTYDDRIENNAPRIKIFAQMARMLYEEWFVSFRFPGHDRVEMIDSAIVGLIPKGRTPTTIDHATSEDRLSNCIAGTEGFIVMCARVTSDSEVIGSNSQFLVCRRSTRSGR